jgi:CheY-like chemotaxis protein
MLGLFRRSDWPEVSLEEIRKRARLLVVDDSEFPYEPLFRRDGYNLEKWPDVQDLPKLESGYFDLILLDVQGVGGEYSSEQGLGILRHLRKTTPTQLIIAYSSADYSLKYQDFFRLADAVLEKSSDYFEFKRQVDKLLQDRFSLGFYVGRIRALLAGQLDEPERLEKAVRKAVREGSTSAVSRLLSGRVDPDIASVVMNIVQTAITVAQLWKS